MKNVKGIVFYLLLLLCSLIVLGCSQKAGDENKSIDEIKAEAEKMDTAQLRAMAMKYKEAIIAKNEEIEKLIARLKDAPATEMLGDQADKIKAEVESINKSLSALEERFEVYYGKLKEKGGDTSGLEI
jgi:hypothetical protein